MQSVLLICFIWISQPALAKRQPTVPLPPTVPETYLIQVGDDLEISFFKTAELLQQRIVGPDGRIHLLLIGSVQAAGRSIDELTRELTQRYSREVIDPQITVSVLEYTGMQVYVGGAVEKPGVIPYHGNLTAVQAIMGAGGFRTTAGLKNVLLIRKGADNKPVGSVVNVRHILIKGRFEQDVALAPSDIIYVPRSKIANLNQFMEEYFRNNMPIPVGLGFDIGIND